MGACSGYSEDSRTERTRARAQAALVVSAEDCETLERWTRRQSTAQALALRSRIMLGCSTGMSTTDVAEELHVINATVGRWRPRFEAPTSVEGFRMGPATADLLADSLHGGGRDEGLRIAGPGEQVLTSRSHQRILA